MNMSPAATVSLVLDEIRRHALSEASEKANEWREVRDRLIREAYSAGATYREIADAVGLAHTGVRKIVLKENTP